MWTAICIMTSVGEPRLGAYIQVCSLLRLTATSLCISIILGSNMLMG
uniref:Uncharacterized protein n=1 Tax=Arundo donax TaxID=35708 RepID=A0A0A9FCG8_ARUDO